jgi:hypothetical protein
MDDDEPHFERSCERDENNGMPPARLTEVTFTVRLPGFSGDTVSGRFHVSEEER